MTMVGFVNDCNKICIMHALDRRFLVMLKASFELNLSAEVVFNFKGTLVRMFNSDYSTVGPDVTLKLLLFFSSIFSGGFLQSH